jgi:hypothetical protein
MMMSIRSLVVGAVLGAAVAAATGVALASIPDSGGVVHACWQNVTSATKPVKLLDTAKSTQCPTGWSAVAWNKTGPQGAPGVSGYQVVSTPVTVAGNTFTTVSAQCPAGDVAIGGGYLQTPLPGWSTLNELRILGVIERHHNRRMVGIYR